MSVMTRRNKILTTVGLVILSGWVVTVACQPSDECKEGTCGTVCPTKACAPDAASAPEKVVQPAEITTPVFERLIGSGVKVTILDARTGKWDDGLRIAGARTLSPEATEEVVKTVVSTKDELVVTYCANLKCPASHHLAKRLAVLGYRNVLIYSAGIAGWKEAGHEVVKAQ